MVASTAWTILGHRRLDLWRLGLDEGECYGMTPQPLVQHARCIRHSLSSASIFLIGACATGGAPPSDATISRLDETTIDSAALTRQIDALTRAANVHGLTVTIFNEAEPVYTRAFGFADQPAGKRLRTDTEIYGASLSKAVFSVLVMKLVEQGVLDLDKPLQEYVSTPLFENRGTSWAHPHENAVRPGSVGDDVRE